MLVNENDVEVSLLQWFGNLGYTRRYGLDIDPQGSAVERASYKDIILQDRLFAALARLNPRLSHEACDEVLRKLLHLDHPNLVERNQLFHEMLVDGVPVENRRLDGTIAGDRAQLVDFTHPERNDWLVVNQFTVIEHPPHQRRADVVVFVNGLPLALIELKNPADEKTTIQDAFKQLQTYKQDMPSLFAYNALLVISDGLEARAGTLTSDWERFQPWRTVDGTSIAPRHELELKTLTLGMFEQQRFLDLLRHFIVFEVDGATTYKKIAAYHQFHAVNKALHETLKASSLNGDKRAGVIWHTQGSGKSLTMAFYAGKIILHPRMENPTLVVLTDRNDLDGQLFSTFSRCQALLRQKPERAESREHLKSLLQVSSGGVIFTTIQKFFPEDGVEYPLLSERRNIIFIADEAHRSQYGLHAHLVKDEERNEAHITYGFAKYLRDALPNASFIGFTGTPIESNDRNTKAIFGDYIDVYDIHRAVEDGATVRIYYEARLAQLDLDEQERPKIDPSFEEVTEGQEQEAKEKLKSKWGRLEALVGSEKRLKQIAKDLVEHFELRLNAMEGKAMIVCMSRRICVELYNAIIQLRPEWHHPDDDKGVIKVVMTGSAADGPAWQQHIRSKKRSDDIAKRFKDPNDPLKLVIVRDMWLTGFDVPCLHTMYLDKPMRGHGLMQAIARVNRVFKDKPGGLVVDYIGLAEALKQALHDYTEADRGEAGVNQEQAVAVMEEKFEVVHDLFFGFPYERRLQGTAEERLRLLPAAMDHILGLPDGKKRFLQAVTELSKALALAMPHPRALELRDKIAFFQAVRAAFVKKTPGNGKTRDDLDHAVRQIVSRAVTSGEVIDVYKTLGIQQPTIELFSDSFLEEIRHLPYRNLAVEMLTKLLNDQIKVRFRSNVVEARSFEERLEQTVRRYQNQSLEAAQVIAEVITIAKDIRAARNRGVQLGLNDEELAFYDALLTNENAQQVLSNEKLCTIAQELVRVVRQNITIDWNIRESARAKMRTIIKRLLRQHGYPLDSQAREISTLIEQMEYLSKTWAA